jgi:hypothetical protein
MEDQQLGQTAYEAYRDQADGRSLVSGEPLPAWPQLNDDIREAWQAAALAVVALAAPGVIAGGCAAPAQSAPIEPTAA